VSENGAVQNIEVVGGHPLLIEEAIKSIRTWKYRPARQNGDSIASHIVINVTFALELTHRNDTLPD
jgi:TonB family protein